MKKKQAPFYLFILIYCLPMSGYSQLDSLWNVWNNQEVDDTLRMDAMKQICWDGYLFSQPDSAYFFAEQLFELAQATKHKKFQARSFNIRAISLHVRGKSDAAIPLFEKCLEIYKSINFKKGVASTLNNISKAYQHLGQYEKALENLYLSRKLTEEIGDLEGGNLALTNIAEIHTWLGEYDTAIKLFNQCKAYHESINDKSGTGQILRSISNIQRIQGSLDQALPNAQQSVRLLEESNGKGLAMGNAYNQLGEIYSLISEPDSALKYYDLALNEYTLAQNKNGINITSSNIGELYLQRGNIETAERYAMLSLDAAKQTNDHSLERNSYSLYADIYEKKGDYKNAFTYNNLYWEVHNNIYNDENKSALLEQEIKYKYEKQKVIDELAINEASRRNKLIVFFLSSLLLFLLIIALIEYRSRKAKQQMVEDLQLKSVEIQAANKKILQTQEQLIQQEKLASLGQLTAGIAHEIKNPLNFISNFSEDSKELVEEIDLTFSPFKNNIPDAENKLIQSNLNDLKLNITDIIENSFRVDQIINNMMSHTRKSEMTLVPTDINELVNINTDFAYKGFAAAHKKFFAEVKKQFTPKLILANVYPQELGRVILNLINNACYATHTKRMENPVDYTPTITISTLMKDQSIQIIVKDNGPGIPAKIKEDIFNPFFTTKPPGEANTGLGLSISFDTITHLHKGTLKVESEEGVFTIFTIHLPMT